MAVDLGIIGDDHAAFPGRDLLVGIKSKHSGIGDRPYFSSVIFGADGLAGVFNHSQAMASRYVEKRSHLGGSTERVNNEDGARFRRDRCFYFFWIEIERGRVDVDENGSRPFHANDVGCGDERERRNDDLVTRANAETADAKMQSAGAGVDGDRVIGSNIIGGGTLKCFQFGAEAELRRAQNIDNRFDLGLCDGWSRQRNANRRHGFARAGDAG